MKLCLSKVSIIRKIWVQGFGAVYNPAASLKLIYKNLCDTKSHDKELHVTSKNYHDTFLQNLTNLYSNLKILRALKLLDLEHM